MILNLKKNENKNKNEALRCSNNGKYPEVQNYKHKKRWVVSYLFSLPFSLDSFHFQKQGR